MTEQHGTAAPGRALALEDPTIDGFLRVAERGSVTMAAEELGLTQSGLSRQLQRLERRLGRRLFVRIHGGVRLTRDGQRYRAYAEDVQVRRRRLLNELRLDDAASAALEGELRIAASTTPSEVLVPRLVGEFVAQYPQVVPRIMVADTAAVVEEIADGRSAVGFAGARLPSEGVRFDPVATDEVVLAVPVSHPFARRREVPLASLHSQPFLEREGGSGTLASVRQALAERDLPLPPYTLRMTLSSTHALVAAVRDGYGIGFVSSLALREGQAERVVPVRLAGIPIIRRLYLVRNQTRPITPAAERFIELVLATVEPGLPRLP